MRKFYKPTVICTNTTVVYKKLCSKYDYLRHFTNLCKTTSFFIKQTAESIERHERNIRKQL